MAKATGAGAIDSIWSDGKPPGFVPTRGVDQPVAAYSLGPGMRVRLTALRGETPKDILTRRLYLPAVLNDVIVEEDADHTDFKTQRLGEFSVPAQGGRRARNLRELPFEALTLDWEADWLVEYRDPYAVRRELAKILRSKKPVYMLAMVRFGRGQHEEFRGPVTLRRTARTLKPGEADTRYWTIEFKEWRKLDGARLSSTPAKNGRELPTTHRLKATTTLDALSDLYYGTERYWTDIAKANGIRNWGPRSYLVNMSRYKVGDPIRIPERPRRKRVRGDLLDLNTVRR